MFKFLAYIVAISLIIKLPYIIRSPIYLSKLCYEYLIIEIHSQVLKNLTRQHASAKLSTPKMLQPSFFSLSVYLNMYFYTFWTAMYYNSNFFF